MSATIKKPKKKEEKTMGDSFDNSKSNDNTLSSTMDYSRTMPRSNNIKQEFNVIAGT